MGSEVMEFGLNGTVIDSKLMELDSKVMEPHSKLMEFGSKVMESNSKLMEFTLNLVLITMTMTNAYFRRSEKAILVIPEFPSHWRRDLRNTLPTAFL